MECCVVADSSENKSRFLVLYDYGQGGVWAYVWARSPMEITEIFRDLVVVEKQPDWMGASDIARIDETMTFDVDRLAPSDWIIRLLREPK
jgi:hypothetical protein